MGELYDGFLGLGSDFKDLNINLVCTPDEALDLFITKGPNGAANCYISAFSNNAPEGLAHIRNLASIGNQESLSTFDHQSIDDRQVEISITGEGSVRKALSIVTNHYLGALTYAGFGHDSHGLYGYWDNEKLIDLHQKVADFFPGAEGDGSREYLRNADRFWTYKQLGAIFGKSATDTARRFRHDEVDRLGTYIGRARRTIGRAASKIISTAPARTNAPLEFKR